MRKTMLMSFALLGLAASPAMADSSVVTTQSPPSPNSAQAGIQPDGSLPATAETSERNLAGSQVGLDQAQSARVSPGGQIMRNSATPQRTTR